MARTKNVPGVKLSDDEKTLVHKNIFAAKTQLKAMSYAGIGFFKFKRMIRGGEISKQQHSRLLEFCKMHHGSKSLDL